jgi:glycine oxidase
VTKSQDVVVIGGGAVGAACGYELARERSVLVLDPRNRAGAGWRASAGLLAPQIDAREDSGLFELGIAGREYYRDKAEEIEADSGIDIDLYDGGILHLARGGAEEDRLRSAVAWQRQHGHRAEWLDPAEVRADFPWAGPNDGALWAGHDGSVDPLRLVEAFTAGAVRRGAVFEPTLALGLVLDGGRATGVRTLDGLRAAGQVVVAAGAWSGRLENLPRPISVEPVRGQMIAKPWPDNVPRAIAYGSHGYVLARGGEAWCGSTVEHAGFAAEPTEAGVRSVAEGAAGLIPAVGSLPTVRSWAGLRPGTPDGLPIVGGEPGVANLWYATGHGRNGILLAGITAVALTHLLNGEATFEGVEAMRPERFWTW